jgi:hypothetical protein
MSNLSPIYRIPPENASKDCNDSAGRLELPPNPETDLTGWKVWLNRRWYRWNSQQRSRQENSVTTVNKQGETRTVQWGRPARQQGHPHDQWDNWHRGVTPSGTGETLASRPVTSRPAASTPAAPIQERGTLQSTVNPDQYLGKTIIRQAGPHIKWVHEKPHSTTPAAFTPVASKPYYASTPVPRTPYYASTPVPRTPYYASTPVPRTPYYASTPVPPSPQGYIGSKLTTNYYPKYHYVTSQEQSPQFHNPIMTHRRRTGGYKPSRKQKKKNNKTKKSTRRRNF